MEKIQLARRRNFAGISQFLSELPVFDLKLLERIERPDIEALAAGRRWIRESAPYFSSDLEPAFVGGIPQHVEVAGERKFQNLGRELAMVRLTQNSAQFMMTRPRQTSLLHRTLHFSWTAVAPQTGQTIDAVSSRGGCTPRGSAGGDFELSVSPSSFAVIPAILSAEPAVGEPFPFVIRGGVEESLAVSEALLPHI
jgi:hypothetical protein